MRDKNKTDDPVPVSDELEKKRREFQEEVQDTKPKKANRKVEKKKLAFGLVILGFLLVGLASAAVYALWFNPERAVSDAIVRALSSETLRFSGTLVAGKSLDMQFDGASAGSEGLKLTLNARVDINGSRQTVGSDIVMDKDGNLYLSAGGIYNVLGPDLIETAQNDEDSYARLLLQKLEGKWLMITSNELAPYSKKISSVQSCIETVIKKNQGQGPVFGQSAEIYKRNEFIVVDGILGVRGTSTGYKVHINNEKLKAFLVEFKATVLYHQFQECDSATFALDPDTFVKRLEKRTKELELWINQAHEITEISSKGTLGNLAMEFRVNPEFNQESKIIVPTETISLKTLHDYMLDHTQAESLKAQSDEASKKLLQSLKDKLNAAE